jgi:hypothetical protein
VKSSSATKLENGAIVYVEIEEGSAHPFDAPNSLQNAIQARLEETIRSWRTNSPQMRVVEVIKDDDDEA